MMPGDFDEIARLWQQAPSAEDERTFQELARRASRRGRWLQGAEWGTGAAIAVAVVIALVLRPAPATVAIGLLVIAAISWSSWKRYLLHQVAALLDTGDRRAFVGAAAENRAADLRRSNLGLWLLLPSVLLGAMLRYSVASGGDLVHFPEALLAAALVWPTGPTALLVLLLSYAFLIRSNLQIRTELRRLEILRRQYREEALLDENSLL